MRVLAGLCLCVALSGCFTTSADFQEEAESFIVDDPGIVDALGVAMVSATCEEPVDRDVGRTFSCSAVDVDGEDHAFQVEITGETSFEVTVAPLGE